MKSLNLEQQLILFRNVNSYQKKIVNGHMNFMQGNNVRCGNINQGIAEAKFLEFLSKEEINRADWFQL